MFNIKNICKELRFVVTNLALRTKFCFFYSASNNTAANKDVPEICGCCDVKPRQAVVIL
jgi:hypothetical protein